MGLEVGFQHDLTWRPAPLDELGVTTNTIFLRNMTATTATDTTQAPDGLGRSQNPVVFDKTSGFQPRAAYNHRNQFIQTLANGTGGHRSAYRPKASSMPRHPAYATVFTEGVNITNDKTLTRGQYDNRFLSIFDTPARYAVDDRFNF